MGVSNKILEAKDRTIAAIFHLSTLLTQQVGLDEILRSILVSAEQELGFSASCLFLINEDGEYLDCRMVRGFGVKNEKRAYRKPFHLHRHECIETMAVKYGEVICFENSKEDPRATDIDRRITDRLKRGQIIYAPLTAKGKIIGCMGVNRPLDGPRISKSEIEAFTIFANQASIIIENRRFHEQLMAERNLNKSILESSPSGILTIDRKGIITSTNGEAARIFGVDPNMILSQRVDEAALEYSCFRFFEDLFCNPVSGTKEYEYIGNDGLQHAVEVTVTTLKGESGEEAGILFVFNDHTEKKRIGEQIQRMSKLAAVGQLAAGISHEIRNPMMGIAATMELISDGMDPDHPQRRLLAKSMDEIGRIDNVIGELLNLAQPREMHLELADINDLIGDVADFLSGLCRKKQIELLLHCSPQMPLVSMDRKAMREVIINVALNAIQSMREAGCLTIQTASSGEGLVNGESGSVQITIEDTGDGIPQEIRDKIFDPFFTTRPGGTGLGLSNCHRIVVAHAGSIFIEDIPTGGTRFHVMLPTASEKER
ncbi:MAG: ATP-binding protein [Syntrophales bacterium]|jgi:PAS domain S-box-containing protein|nr:ATP-binding protein [Syntrophales bacterium]MCK9392202.1 ATP-binding protein [Syntrophales bacterium]